MSVAVAVSNALVLRFLCMRMCVCLCLGYDDSKHMHTNIHTVIQTYIVVVFYIVRYENAFISHSSPVAALEAR